MPWKGPEGSAPGKGGIRWRLLDFVFDPIAVVIFSTTGRAFASSVPRSQVRDLEAVGLYVLVAVYGMMAVGWVQLRLLPCMDRLASTCTRQTDTGDTSSPAASGFPRVALLANLAVVLATVLGPPNAWLLISLRTAHGPELAAGPVDWTDSDTQWWLVAFASMQDCVLASVVGAQWFFLRCLMGRIRLSGYRLLASVIIWPGLSALICVAGLGVLWDFRSLDSRRLVALVLVNVLAFLGALAMALLTGFAVLYWMSVRAWGQTIATRHTA
jgi:hypothetical protein